MNRRLFALIGLFVLGVLAHQAVLPPLEFPEEHLHLNYVELLRAENRLPDRTAFLTNPTERESGQPPLAYWLSSLPLRLLNLPALDGGDVMQYLSGVKNLWYTPPDVWNRQDNLNLYLHGEGDTALSRPDILTIDHILRLTMIAWGVLSVWGAYGAARQIFAAEKWALVAAAIFAFTPTMIHVHAYFNNDGACIAFSTLIVWQSLQLLRLGTSPRRLLILGLLIGLGCLAKVSTLLVVPGAMLAVIFVSWRGEQGRGDRPVAPTNVSMFGRLFLNGLLVGIPAALIFAPWLLYGMTSYGDPFGFSTHLLPGLHRETLLSVGEMLPLLRWVYLTYWGLFGTLILFNPVTYTILAGILVLAAVGYLTLHRRRRTSPPGPLSASREGEKSANSPSPFTVMTLTGLVRERGLGGEVTPGKAGNWQQILVLAAVFLGVFVGLIRWLQEIYFIPGRLLYPAHVVMAIAVTGGLVLLVRRYPRLEAPARILPVGLLMCASLILAPAAMLQAYAPPRQLTAAELPALEGQPIDFDGTIRFLGYSQPDPYIHTGDLHSMTLCWEVLRETDHPAAYTLKLIRDGVIVGSRTSIPRLGHYDSRFWQVGDRWCETLDVRIEEPLRQGQVYDVLLAMLNARTQEFDWPPTLPDGAPIDPPFVGQVVSPAGDMSGEIAGELAPMDISYPGFADLEGYSEEGRYQPGKTVRLDLLWRVTGRIPDSWSQFIHLIGPNNLALSLADGIPRDGNYPTWAWSLGERVADTWEFTLPDDLPPGRYTIGLGFYRQDTGERMDVTSVGQVSGNRIADLLYFQVQ